jgi:hypothetical protein
MQTYIRMMHSTPARLIRLFFGLWLVIYGADLPVAYALTLAIMGAALAVTGIADICPMELLEIAGAASAGGLIAR